MKVICERPHRLHDYVQVPVYQAAYRDHGIFKALLPNIVPVLNHYCQADVATPKSTSIEQDIKTKRAKMLVVSQ